MTSGADGIEPDTKNWTWVLERPCEECGFDARGIEPAEVPRLLRDGARTWHGVLTAGGSVATRPAPKVWSPLEYGCHVRDVFRVFDGRLQRMLAETDPLFENWDQDKTAIETGYAEQEPAVVAEELRASGEQLASAFAAVDGADWERTGSRDDGAVFTVGTLSRYLIHDVVHHVYDVTGVRAGH